MKKRLFIFTLLACSFGMLQAQNKLPVHHPAMGTEAASPDGQVKMRLVGKHQQFSMRTEGYDTDIHSPKSVNIHPDGTKYYVNSLEGCATVVYDMQTHEKKSVISHNFGPQHATLWAPPSDFYTFTHYPKNNNFAGKPVESCFSHEGRYLWVPYYRRSYDINAQDPSAIAVVDTRTDSIIRLFETGPLPKMIACSHDGKTIAVSHWGNNTVGLIDIDSNDPQQWHHRKMLVVDYILPLNFSLTVPADRDNGSGYALRGTAFTADDQYLLVGCMGGGGGIAVIDVQKGEYLGRVLGMMANVRHLVIFQNYLYLSINGDGVVQRIQLQELLKEAKQMQQDGKKTCTVKGWESCSVGKGARTLELSPSGKYAFVACNNVSQLCVVDTRVMKQIASIEVDSYPVGLDISDDGRYVIVTSQGRGNDGGNAVNIYEVEYATPEVSPQAAKEEPTTTELNKDEAQADSVQASSGTEKGANASVAPFYFLCAGGAVLLLILLYFVYRKLKA